MMFFDRMALRVLTSLLALSLMAVVSAVAGADIKDGTLQAHSDGTAITIRWATGEEVNLKEFDIERRAGTEGEFVAIGSVSPRGSNSIYQFVDESAFKSGVGVSGTNSSLYQYRIRIVDLSGQVAYSKTVTVTHSVSSVRRTWGSLKAMFR